MEIDIKISKENENGYSMDKTYFEEFSKKWEIATSRLKPFLAEKEETNNGRSAKVYSYR